VSETAWGWLLLGAEMLGLIAMAQLVGKRRLWWGWLVIFACVSAPWLAYSINCARWPFLFLSIMWASVHLSNAMRWRLDHHD